ncbi:MAG TPA: Ig-like domain-containing protein [Tepidisphaeraceae bacterium]|jgi:subtilisin-like proprotein convertase family protein
MRRLRSAGRFSHRLNLVSETVGATALLARFRSKGTARARQAHCHTLLVDALEGRVLLSTLPAPTTTFDQSITGNSTGTNYSSPTIAVDPNQPLDVVEASTASNGQVQLAYSIDGGAMWNSIKLPANDTDPLTTNPYAVSSDPSISFDSADNFYVSYLQRSSDFNEGEIAIQVYNFPAASAPSNTVEHVAYDWVGTSLAAYTPAIAVDASQASYTDTLTSNSVHDKYVGNIYITYTSGGVPWLMGSSDGGTLFSLPMEQSSTTTDGPAQSVNAAAPKLVVNQGTELGNPVGGDVTEVWGNTSDGSISSQTVTGMAVDGVAAAGPVTIGVATTTPIPITVNFTDAKFTTLTDMGFLLNMTDPDMGQVSATLTAPASAGGATFTLFLNKEIAGTSANSVTQVAPPQGISGADMDALFDDQAILAIDASTSTSHVGVFRPEDPANAGLGASPFDSLVGKTAAQLNGTWTLKITTYENFSSPPPAQTLNDVGFVFTSGGSPTAKPVKIGTGLTDSQTGSNFTKKVTADPQAGIGPGISLALDSTLGAYSQYSGRIYVAYTDSGSNGNIALAYSDNEGGTWTTASTAVNDDGGGNSQFAPAVAVDPDNGTVVLTWYDARDDNADARVGRYITTSIDGGNTFGGQTFLNEPNDVYDAITGQAVDLGPIPDNASQGANGTVGFGDSQGLAVVGGRVYAAWSGNENGGVNGNRGLDILTSTTTYAAGPRVVSSTEGVVSTADDILNPSVDNSPELQYIDVTFDRAIVPDAGLTYDPDTDLYYFDRSTITIYYRNDSTPGTAPPTSILSGSDILSIEPLDFGDFGNAQEPAATEFRIAIVPQTAVGTYTYSISDPVESTSPLTYAINDGFTFKGLGNYQSPYDISATSSDAAASISGDTNLVVPSSNSTTQYSYITIPGSLPTADVGGTIVDVNVTVDLDGPNDASSYLSLFLEDPNGNIIPLAINRVGASQTTADVGSNATIGGNGFISTVFDDQATTPVAFGNYQFSGTYQPDTSDGIVDAADGQVKNAALNATVNQSLATFTGDTLNVGDEWTLIVVSNKSNNGINQTGLLRDWSLQFTTGTVGSYTGNPMDQNADSITGEAAQSQTTTLGGPATTPGTIGDTYVIPAPTSNNSYTTAGGGNYFAAPYDDSTLPLMIPGPEVLSTREYTATVTSSNIPAATNATTPGTLSNTITVGGDSDVVISNLMVKLNLDTSAGDVDSLVIQLIYTPTGGGVSDEIPITLTSEVAGGGSSFGGTIGGEFIPTIFSDDAAGSIQNSAYASPYTGYYQPASPLSDLNGQTLAGTYQLVVRNYDTGNTETLNGWSIVASTAISATNPNNGAGINSIDVYFSQPMDSTSVVDAPVTLTGPNGAITGPFTVTWDPTHDGNYEDQGIATLNQAIASGATGITSLVIDPLTSPLAAGTAIELGSDTTYLTQAAPVGATTLAVSSFTAGAAHAVGDSIITVEARTFKISFASPVNLTGGYSLVLGAPGTEPQSMEGTALDSNSDAGLEMLRDESTTTATYTASNATVTPISKFNGADGITQSTVTLNSTPAQDFIISGASVTLQLAYPRASELSVMLIAPDGTAIQLFGNLSSTGKLIGSDSIVLSDEASVSISTGSAPYLGVFSPQEPLSYLNGLVSGGTWTLQVKDNGANVGNLVSWSLSLTGSNPNSGAGTSAGDDATVGFNVFNSGGSGAGASNPESHEVWIPLMTAAAAASGSSSSNTSTPGPVSAVAVDPSDPTGNTVYIGASTGGVWKTTDFLTDAASGPTYVPLTDQPLPGTTIPDALNIGSIAVLGSQTVGGTTYPSMIFAATGQLSDPSATDNAPGVGILVSTDGGQTWNLASGLNNYASGSWLPLSSTARDNDFVGTISYKIIVDPTLQADGDAIVYLALSDPSTGAKNFGGLYRSIDSGKTWSLMRAGQATDVAFEADSSVGTFQQGQNSTQQNLNNIVAAFAGDGIYFSPNRGQVWTPLLGGVGDPTILNGSNPVSVAAAGSPNGNNGRIVLATPELTGNAVQDLLYSGWIYAVVISGTVNTGSGHIVGIYMTKDNGDNWTKLTLNPSFDVTAGAGIPAGTGNYDISLAVDPSNPNVIYVGGNATATGSDGMIRIDTTGISDAHSFYQGETSSDGGQLRVNTTDVASTNGGTGTYSTTIEQPTINLLQNPSQPFLANATINVSDITQFGNTGDGISWIPFDSAFAGAENYNAIVTVPDETTGGVRIIVATGQGIYTGIDEDGTLLTPATIAGGGGTPGIISGSRSGNLSIAEIYYGAVQPSQNAADIAGAMFYGNTQGLGLISSDPNILTDGNTTWTANPVPGSGAGVATDSTGTGAVYQYTSPFFSGAGTNFFQVDGVGRTNGLFATTTGTDTTHDPQWPDFSTNGNGTIGSNFAVDPIDGNQIVMSSQTGRIYATQTQGKTWSLISPNAGLDGTYAPAVAFGAPGNGVTTGTFIYAGTTGGHVYVTFTGGGGGTANAWTNISIPNLPSGDFVEALVTDPVPGSTDVYAVTQHAIYQTNVGTLETGGRFAGWTNITSNLSNLLALSYGLPNLLTTMTADWRYAAPVLYVGADAGVYRGIENTTTHKWTWTLFPDEATDDSPVDGGYLPDVKVTDLDLSTGNVDPTTGLPETSPGDPDALLASTFGRGAYAIRLAPIVSSTAAAVPAALPLDKIINTSTSTTTSYITNARTLTISGSSEKAITGYNSALISVYELDANGNPVAFLGGYNPNNPTGLNSATYPANTADANGNFTITTNVALPNVNGTYTIGIEATDNAGVTGAFSKIAVSLEVTPPSISSLSLAPASDTGSNTADNKTKNNTPTIIGTGAAGATVTIYVNGVAQTLNAFADSNGNFSYTFASPLADGSYVVSATEVDALGNQSVVPNTQFTMVIDTTIATPTAPTLLTADDSGISSTDGVTNVTTPTFTGSLPASDSINNGPYVVTLTVTPTSGTAVTYTQTVSDPTTGYSIPITAALADGNYSVTVTQTDVEGNVSTASPATALTIDTTVPLVFADNLPDVAVPTVAALSPLNNIQVATFMDLNGGGTATVDWGDGSSVDTLTFTPNDPNSPIQFVGGTTWEVLDSHVYATQGTYTTTVSVTDAAGNTGVVSNGTIVVAPPTVVFQTQTAYMVAGTTFDSIIAKFTSGVPNDSNFYVQSIDWGDGEIDTSPDNVSNPAGVTIVPDPSDPSGLLYDVIASHSYGTSPTPHQYSVTITVGTTDMSAQAGTGVITLYAEAPTQFIKVTPQAISTQEGSTQTVEVADITNNGDLSATDFASDFSQGDFTASINWGDGTTTSTSDSNNDVAIVSDGNGGYMVLASHAYADGTQNGTSETVSTTVSVEGTAVAPVSATATVANVAPTITNIGGTSFGFAGQSLSFPITVNDPGTTDTSHGFTYSITWGDGHSTTVAGLSGYAPTHTYAANGNYTITITATDKDNGVSTAVQHAVQIAQLSGEPNFTVNEGTPLIAYPVAYISGASSQPSFSAISVNWGDGTTDNSATDSDIVIVPGNGGTYVIEDNHTYPDGTAAGSHYSITVSVTPSGSSAVTALETATVDNVAPTLQAGIPTTALAGESVSLPLTVTDPGITDTSTGFTYSINWGDGNTQTIAASHNNGNGSLAPQHTYVAAGTYAITVTATDKDSAVSNTEQADVSVAGATGDNISASEGTQFSGTVATISNTADFYPGQFTASINWGDGNTSAGSITSNGDGTYSVTGTHTYADGPATQTITTSIGFNGGSNQVTSTATVANVAPSATVSGPAFALAGQSVTFTLGAGDLSSADLAAGFIYTVNFGDGTTQTIQRSPGDNSGQTVTHAYSSSGNYTVSVTATDKDNGVSSAATSAIAIAGVNLSSSIASIAEGTTFSGTVATIDDAAAYGNGNFTASINWGDGTTTTGSIVSDGNGTFSINGAHAFGDGPATFTITVTVTANGSQTTSAAGNITVKNVPPTLGITGPVGGFINQSIPLTLTATDPSAADTAAGFTYSINWGDGTTQTISATSNNGSGLAPTHSYSALGDYTVTVTATDKDGGVSNAATTTLDVVQNPQVQNFQGGSGTISFTLPQTTAPISTLTASDLVLVKDGNQTISLSSAPITFNPTTGAVSITTSGLGLTAGDYQLYVLPGTNILPQSFSIGVDDSNLITKTVKLVPGKKPKAPTLHFPKVTLGGAVDAPVALVLLNTSKTQSLTLSDFAFLSSGPFSFAVENQPYGAPQYTIAPGASLTVRVYYTPTAAGSSTNKLRAQFNNGQALNYGAVVGTFIGKAVNPKVSKSITKKILKGE